MGTDYNYEIGYEALQKDFKRYQKETPKGVSLQNKRNKTIVLKFKINDKPKSKGCNCPFTLDGMVDALRKSKLVKEKLETLSSEVEFWNWYDKVILDKNELKNDQITFGEAIKKVEDDFWGRLSRTKKKRDRNNPSDINSYRETYGKFYQWLPKDTLFNLNDINFVISKWETGTTTYIYAVSAMRKLARMNKRRDVLDALEDLDTQQTKFTKLQTIDLEEFLKWKDKVLGVTTRLHKNSNLKTRKAWMWVFSTQIIYALRISEVFAIQNLTEPYVTKDGVTIPALNDPNNTDNLIYIGEILI